jgi:hypothetical protein
MSYVAAGDPCRETTRTAVGVDVGDGEVVDSLVALELAYRFNLDPGTGWRTEHVPRTQVLGVSPRADVSTQNGCPSVATTVPVASPPRHHQHGTCDLDRPPVLPGTFPMWSTDAPVSTHVRLCPRTHKQPVVEGLHWLRTTTPTNRRPQH